MKCACIQFDCFCTVFLQEAPEENSFFIGPEEWAFTDDGDQDSIVLHQVIRMINMGNVLVIVKRWIHNNTVYRERKAVRSEERRVGKECL